jgi:hypothetical protein
MSIEFARKKLQRAVRGLVRAEVSASWAGSARPEEAKFLRSNVRSHKRNVKIAMAEFETAVRAEARPYL